MRASSLSFYQTAKGFLRGSFANNGTNALALANIKGNTRRCVGELLKSQFKDSCSIIVRDSAPAFDVPKGRSLRQTFTSPRRHVQKLGQNHARLNRVRESFFLSEAVPCHSHYRSTP